MSNTNEEMRKRFERMFYDEVGHPSSECNGTWDNGTCDCTYDYKESAVFDWLLAEIEAAEHRRTEEVIDCIDKRLEEIDDPWGDPHIQDWIRTKFLTNPER